MSAELAKSRMERILRLHDQIDEIKGDIREIYAEEKSAGGDKTAMGAAISIIRKRAKDKTAFQEREDMKNVYLHAFDAPSGTRLASHTHAREASGSSNGRTPEFDSGNGGSNTSPETINPETGEIIERTPHSEQSHDAARPSASTGNASGEIPAMNSPASTYKAAAHAPHSMDGVDANTEKDDVDGSASRAGRAGQTENALSGQVETRDNDEFVERNTSGPDAKRAQVSPSAISTRTVEETAEPAVATIPSPRATADQFSRAPVETNPLHEQADVKIPGSNPRETRAGASGEGQRRPPNEVEPGPHSLSPSSEERSSSLTTTAGDVPPLTSPATNFSNPRCRKPDSCHFAHSRDCCHDCLLAWGSKPRDEQLRLWQEAERAARECEAAA